MGCDINIYVEKKVEGKWIPAQGMILFDGNNLPNVPYPDRIYSERDYSLFGFLTEGHVRSDPCIYLGKLKGFPNDASKEVRDIYEDWGGDAHTPNYFTLKEMKEFDWENSFISQYGMVKNDEWKRFSDAYDKGEPTIMRMYCSMTNCPDFEYHEWKVPAKLVFKTFYDVVDKLRRYDYSCKEDEIRIVFWFDN